MTDYGKPLLSAGFRLRAPPGAPQLLRRSVA